MTAYPTAEDYIKAVQLPQTSFTAPELVQARFAVQRTLGIPVPASGTSAVVFRATVAGTDQALRFFTREDASTRQRYTALSSWFTDHGLAGDVASSRWVDDAILVGERRWPMVQMEWVDGPTLDQRVEDLAVTGDQAGLHALATGWRDLVRRTQAARFAHGDLQHGNVLVDPVGRLRLVDFDSSWIVPFTGAIPPTERGHRNYQPRNRQWGPWMDTFSGLVIYLSLLALARDPSQWGRFHNGENLLFGHHDYRPPHQTPVWDHLARLGDPQIDRLAARLQACCAPAWTPTGDLESLLASPAPWWTSPTIRVAAPVGAPAPPPLQQPPGSRTEWWQQTPAPATEEKTEAPPNGARYALATLAFLAILGAGVSLSMNAADPGAGTAIALLLGTLAFFLVARPRGSRPPGDGG